MRLSCRYISLFYGKSYLMIMLCLADYVPFRLLIDHYDITSCSLGMTSRRKVKRNPALLSSFRMFSATQPRWPRDVTAFIFTFPNANAGGVPSLFFNLDDALASRTSGWRAHTLSPPVTEAERRERTGSRTAQLES